MTFVDAAAPITAIEFFAGGGGFSHAFRVATQGLGRKSKLLLLSVEYNGSYPLLVKDEVAETLKKGIKSYSQTFDLHHRI